MSDDGALRLRLDEPLPVTAGGPPRVRASSGAAYEGGASTRRTLGWRAPTASANAAILYNLTLLRDRSRNATRNDGYAKGAIDKLTSNLIGTGIKPLSQADDAAFRQAIQALWLAWTDESDADGRLDFYGQQAQATRAWLEAGEVFIRLRPRLPTDGLSVPLQLQVIEPELCPHHYTAIVNGKIIRAGIEFDGIGRRTAYWFHPTRPDLNDMYPNEFYSSQLTRVPAEAVIHLYDPLRPGQLRGVPHLTQALIRLNELDKYDDATLMRQQLANMFVGFVTSPPTIGNQETLHPLTGLTAETSDDGDPLLSLEPGIFQELRPGEDVKFSDPPEVRSGYREFVRQQLYHVAAATGVPYELLTGDFTSVNDRTVRVILHDFRRRLQAWQHQILAFQFCRPVWRAWMDRVFLSGALQIAAAYVTDPAPWARVKWMPQGWPYVHPVQDVEAQKEGIRNGFTTRSAVVSELGEDTAEIDANQAADNTRADALGLHYDSDGRAPAAGGIPTVPPETSPAAAALQASVTAMVTRVEHLAQQPPPAPHLTINNPVTIHPAPVTIAEGAIAIAIAAAEAPHVDLHAGDVHIDPGAVVVQPAPRTTHVRIAEVSRDTTVQHDAQGQLTGSHSTTTTTIETVDAPVEDQE